MKLNRILLRASGLVLAASTLQVPSAAQLTAPLVLPGDLLAAPAAGDQRAAAIAHGSTSSLLVWEDDRARLTGSVSTGGYTEGAPDVLGARIDDAGNRIDATPIVIAQAGFGQLAPRVAWNGQSWLVVWTSRRPTTYSTTQGVYAARVSAAGQVLDDPPIRIADSDSFDEYGQVVASSGGNWAVLWHGVVVPNEGAVLGCLVSPSGTPDAPRVLFTAPGGVGFYLPTNFDLAFASNRYLMVSEHYPAGGGASDDILGQLFDATLAKIGGEFPIAGNYTNETAARIASNGTHFGVAWKDDFGSIGRILGTPVLADGSVITPGGVDLAPGVFTGYPFPSIGWDGTNWAVAFDEYNLIEVTRMSMAGTIAAAHVAVSQGNASTKSPACADLPGAVAIVWTDARSSSQDLYAGVVPATGSPGPDHCLSLSPPAQNAPDVAGDAAHGYLVAFVSQSASETRVLAQRVDSFGAALDAQPILFAAGPRNLHDPAVAWNGTLWLVAWEEATGTNPSTGRIWVRRMSADGSLPDAAPYIALPGNDPDVAAVGDAFLVVSTDATSSQIRFLKGVRIRGSDGAVLDSAPFAISGSFSFAPGVTAFSDRWLVAWEQHATHDNQHSSVGANFVLSTGQPQTPFTAGLTSLYNRTPSCAADADVALIAWGDSADIRGRRVQVDGTKLDSDAGLVLSDANNTQFLPAMGWDGSGFVAAFVDYRAHLSPLDAGVGDVFAARITAGGAVVDPLGIAVAADFSVPEGQPAVAGSQGTSLIACSQLHDEAPFGCVRITLRGLSNTGASTPFCFGDGSAGACPCANDGAPGRGCQNSAGTGGALLSALGSASLSNDTLVLGSSGELPQAPSIFLQGTTAIAPLGFGDGLRCASGALKRLYIRNASSGFVSAPQPGDPSISARSAALGDTLATGATRHYQTYYRDPDLGFCASPTGNTWNISSGLSVVWLQ